MEQEKQGCKDCFGEKWEMDARVVETQGFLWLCRGSSEGRTIAGQGLALETSNAQEEFIRIVSEIVKLAGGFCLPYMYPSSDVLKKISGMRIKLEKLHRASDKILENIVNEHKEKRNKMIEAAAKEQGDLEFPLSNDYIKGVIQDMFAAGSETTATTIEWAMSELLKNQKLMKQAQNEVIERDPCYWKEAEEFRPERFSNSSIDFRGTNFEYIPFGAGRRICPYSSSN
ncbi:hypothetical protein CRYUN_Cryun38cG0073700 [Craigia yunnanensis]